MPWWVLALAAVLALWPGGARAEPVDHVVARHRLADSEALYDLARLQRAEAVAFEQLLAAGYGLAPVWVRLRVDPGLTAGRRGERLLLRVRPGYLDEVALFDPAGPTQPTGFTGDRHPLADQSRRSIVFNVALAASEAPRDVLVRLTTATARVAHFEVLREDDLLLLDMREMLWSSVYVGMLALFAFWGVAQLLIRRDGLTVVFVVFQLASLTYGLLALGFVRVLFDHQMAPERVDRLTGVMVLVAVFMGLLFNAELLRVMRARRWGLHAIYAVLAVQASLLIPLLGGHFSFALQVNMVMILLVPALALLVAVTACEDGARLPERRLGLTYLLVSMLLTLGAALPGLGLIEGAVITMHIIMFHGVVSGLLMLVLLVYRIFLLVRQRELMAAEAEFGRQRIEQERGFSRDRERLLTMLAHELKTPLATMRMLLGTQGLQGQGLGTARTAVRDMNDVIERCLQVSQLDDGALRLESRACDLNAIVVRVVSAVAGGERVDLCLPSPCPLVMSDPHLMEIVLRNLLDNALKYSPPGSRVDLMLRVDADPAGAVQLQVRNPVGLTGKPDPGMVFTKYYRNRRARRRTGSGLGLYLIQGLVGRLGGSLTYHDEGAFVSFHASWPRRLAEGEQA